MIPGLLRLRAAEGRHFEHDSTQNPSLIILASLLRVRVASDA